MRSCRKSGLRGGVFLAVAPLFLQHDFANCLKASFCRVKHAKKDKIRRKRNYSAVIAEV